MANGAKGRKTRAILGEHNVTSDISGRVFKASEMRKTWNNLVVHYSEYDPKHPQLELRARKEQISVRDARPEGPQYFPDMPNPSDL